MQRKLDGNYWVTLDPQTILEREEKFNQLNYSELTADELYRELIYVVSSDEYPDGYSSIMHLFNTLDTRYFLWRGRLLYNEEDPTSQIRKISDFWEPPEKYVCSAGRLNKPNESLLYTTMNLRAVPAELRAEDGAKILLIKYHVRKPITLTRIGLPLTDIAFDRSGALENAKAVTDFFSRQFVKKVELSDGREYVLSELIAKYNYDLPPEVQHGWVYPSVEFPGAHNVTLRPKVAHQHLEVAGATIGSAILKESNYILKKELFSDGKIHNKKFEWHEKASLVQKMYFPEFSSGQSFTKRL